MLLFDCSRVLQSSWRCRKIEECVVVAFRAGTLVLQWANMEKERRGVSEAGHWHKMYSRKNKAAMIQQKLFIQKGKQHIQIKKPTGLCVCIYLLAGAVFPGFVKTFNGGVDGDAGDEGAGDAGGAAGAEGRRGFEEAGGRYLEEGVLRYCGL